MTSQLTAPTAIGLPPLASEGLTTAAQWRVLMAFMDTVIPAITKGSTVSATTVSESDHLKIKRALEQDNVDTSMLDEYLAEQPTYIPLFRDVLKKTLFALATNLTGHSTRAGVLVLTGYGTPFDQLPVNVRTQLIINWRNSWITPLKVIAKTMTALATNIYIRTSPTINALISFPTVPETWSPKPNYPFEFLQFPRSSVPIQVDTEVLIVGSGCGAGVCAKNLSERGHRVLVVDKGFFYPNSAFPISQATGYNALFEGGGLLSTDDGSVNVTAGSCWGGGGTVNWSASLQLQGYVRKEWSEYHGLPFFQSPAFQDCLDRVCETMQVKETPQNHGNRVLLEGARRLGWHAKIIPQNTGGCAHEDGHCSFGCWNGEKQGPSNRWLPDAANHGARFIEGFKVDKVLFDSSKGQKRARGVIGTWTSRSPDGSSTGSLQARTVQEVIIRASTVIISCGTLQSPLLLMRSGIKNKHVGKNLHLHPVNIIAGVFDHDVKPWEGSCLTSVCTTFENLDGEGHGVKLEPLSMMPSFALNLLNWNNGADYKQLALKYRHMNSYFTLNRDRDTGYVYPDPTTGNPRMSYTPSAFDLKSNMVGMVALARILHNQDASEIHPNLPGVKPFIRNSAAAGSGPGLPDPEFEAWLEEMQRLGIKPPLPSTTAAHQMGTCRMSANPKGGVVGPTGQVWGTEGLYVADASVFPSASGVNPMVTNMAISDWISQNISDSIYKTKSGARL
ncbi:long chain fatty alcohol oxidase-like protein [Thozetella sp. PMI_491]|nr:long chain fatty alcohol oxidase-like protein [Thozetella sp. PMI_491]